MNNLTHYNYIFFRPRESMYSLSPPILKKYKHAFVSVIEQEENHAVYAYTTLGLKAGAEIMLWIQSASVEDMQGFLAKLLHTQLGRHLEMTYTLFGIKRRSVYGNKGTAESIEVVNQERSPYLIVYPFTKTVDWYLLDFEERRQLMHEHIKTGYKYAHIKQHLLYAIGIDDHEFIVSYETDSLEDFQSLVMDMRSTQVRKYTQNDLPIFTCVHKSLSDALALL